MDKVPWHANCTELWQNYLALATHTIHNTHTHTASTHTHAHTHTHARTHTHTRMHAHTQTHTHACTHTQTHARHTRIQDYLEVFKGFTLTVCGLGMDSKRLHPGDIDSNGSSSHGSSSVCKCSS